MRQNEVQNTVQNSVQNEVQDQHASLSFARNQNGHVRRSKNDLFDYTDPDDRELAEAQEVLNNVPDEKIRELSQLALEEMACDARGFVRMLVQRDKSGCLVPASEFGKRQMKIKMARMLKRNQPAIAEKAADVKC